MPAPNPWLSIPLADYEGHMSAASVQQLDALSELFAQAVAQVRPASVAILGIAGGNGLQCLTDKSTQRIVGVDVNPRYLEETSKRYRGLPGLELHCLDLARDDVRLAPVELVHAAMLFEHTGLGRALDNATALVVPSGHLSVVLQFPSMETNDVAPSRFATMQTLADHFALVDVDEFKKLLAQRNLRLADERVHHLPGGKAFWMGLFVR